jgi:hypothetical protein
MESMSRWREPVAFVLVAVIGVRTAVLLVLLALSLGPGERAPGQPSRLRLEAAAFAAELVEPLLIVVLTAVVLLCVRGATRRARGVSILALVVCGIPVLGAVVLEVINLALGGVFSYGLVVTLTLPVLAVAVLVKLVRIRPGTARGELVAVAGVEPAPVEPAADEATTADIAAPEQRQEPGWQPDEASGAAWHSASAAASGAPASGWGRPGESEGWAPIPKPPAEPEQ